MRDMVVVIIAVIFVVAVVAFDALLNMLLINIVLTQYDIEGLNYYSAVAVTILSMGHIVKGKINNNSNK